MITKYIVFGQTHKHPDTGQPLRNSMIKVQAENEKLLNMLVAIKFGPYYSRMINTPDLVHFPNGIIETYIIDIHMFKGETSYELLQMDITAEKINQTQQQKSEEQQDANKRRSRTQTRTVPGEEQKTGSSEPETEGETEPEQQDKPSLDYLSGGADSNGGEDK